MGGVLRTYSFMPHRTAGVLICAVIIVRYASLPMYLLDLVSGILLQFGLVAVFLIVDVVVLSRVGVCPNDFN